MLFIFDGISIPLRAWSEAIKIEFCTKMVKYVLKLVCMKFKFNRSNIEVKQHKFFMI